MNLNIQPFLTYTKAQQITLILEYYFLLFQNYLNLSD